MNTHAQLEHRTGHLNFCGTSCSTALLDLKHFHMGHRHTQDTGISWDTLEALSSASGINMIKPSKPGPSLVGKWNHRHSIMKAINLGG